MFAETWRQLSTFQSSGYYFFETGAIRLLVMALKSKFCTWSGTARAKASPSSYILPYSSLASTAQPLPALCACWMLDASCLCLCFLASRALQGSVAQCCVCGLRLVIRTAGEAVSVR